MADFALGAHDRKIYLYNTHKDSYSKRAICHGHTSFITHLDFSNDSKFLQSNSGDYELLFWDTSGTHITAAARMRDTQWATWSCTLGWPVQGIWPQVTHDLTDINSVSRNSQHDLLVTGDDFGCVKLFRFPALTPHSAEKSISAIPLM